MTGNIMSRLFGRSPVAPLQEHMAKVRECADLLGPFFVAAASGDWGAAEAERSRIVAVEDEADTLKRQLRLRLPSSLMMAMPRRDVLDLLYRQDQIANMARDISGLVLGRRMVLPACLMESYPVFLRRCLDACAQAELTVDELDELVETGFRGVEVQRVEEMIKALDEIEHETDRMQVEVRACLFAMERELPPVDVIFLYKVIEMTGDLADNAQKVGTRVELMLAR